MAFASARTLRTLLAPMQPDIVKWRHRDLVQLMYGASFGKCCNMFSSSTGRAGLETN